MAEAVTSKACSFSFSCSSIRRQNNGVSSFPVKSAMVFSSGMGFPSLKIATFSKKENPRLSSTSPLYAQVCITSSILCVTPFFFFLRSLVVNSCVYVWLFVLISN